MSDQKDHLGDLLGLISQSLDGELDATDSETLRRALAKSETLNDELRDMQAVDRLVKSWGSRSVEVDWTHFAALIDELIASDHETTELDEVDHLVQRWGRGTALSAHVDIDLSDAVLARLNEGSSQRKGWSLVLKFGGVLAAAAAIVLVLITGFEPTNRTTSIVSYAHGFTVSEARAPVANEMKPHVVVAFSHEPISGRGKVEESTGISFGSVGSGPLLD